MSDSAAPPARHLVLVDGSGFLFRAFHALPPMSRPDGTPVNAVFGFCNMLMKLLDDTDADHLAVIFDAARKTFRNDIYPDYKAHRPPPPDELIPQFSLVREAVKAFNVACVDRANYEADDLIATYTKQAVAQGARVTIVSSDKDLMQLVGERVSLMDAMKNKLIGRAEVIEKFGVPPEQVIQVQALAGDSSDNIPGVPGIGVKTAAQLIGQYGDVESLLAHAHEIPQPKRRETLQQNADMARLSLQLVTLRDDVPSEVGLNDFTLRQPEPEILMGFLSAQDFKRIIPKARDRFGGAAGPVGEAANAAAQAPSVSHAAYQLVTDEATLATWIEEARQAGVVAIDTETTSLDAMAAQLVGVSLATAPGRACYVPLAHRNKPAQGGFDFGDSTPDADSPLANQIARDRAVAALKPLLADPAVLKIGQNIKYDMVLLGRHGLAVTPIDDTMLLSYVLAGGAHGHGMDELAQRHLNHKPIAYKDVVGSGKSALTFDLVPLEAARDYAAEDADVTLRLHQVLKPQVLSERLLTVYETLERPLPAILAAMESAGIRVDAHQLRQLSADFATRLGQLESDIHGLAGRPFNVGSPKQLGEILFDEMGLSGGRKGKTGAYSTDAEVLEDLAAQGHDLPARVLEWRQLAKLKSTYTDALLSQINPHTGRVHTSYSMAGTSTGRLASSDPNLQNIPVRTEEGRKIRCAFIAADDHVLLSADYSQIELRLLAHVAGIDALKQAFHDQQDIHALTASQVFGVPLAEMDGPTRRRAKAINFGIIYGISAFGLARQLGISRSEAAAYIDAYFARYPGIVEYMERTKEQARRSGYVETLFGRRIHVRGINDRNQQLRGLAERAAINAPIQGGAADIIKRAMIGLWRALYDTPVGRELGITPLLQVHDELIFEVPRAHVAEAQALITGEMERAAWLDVPLVVDCGVGDNWAEAH